MTGDEKRDGLFVTLVYVGILAALYCVVWGLHYLWETME